MTRLEARLTVTCFVQLVLVWTPGKGSPIHDHGNAHCIMKILHGSLTESRYEFPSADKQQPMELMSERTHKENDVAYMADELGLHKMENRGDDYAISLHCRWFLQPRVARGCPAFDRLDCVADCGQNSVHASQCRQIRVSYLQPHHRRAKLCSQVRLLFQVPATRVNFFFFFIPACRLAT